MEKAKGTSVILCSHFPLPYDGIGSWTTMFNHYLNTDNPIDFILCPKPNVAFSGTEYIEINNGLFFKLAKRLGFKTKYQAYSQAIKNHLKRTNGNVILHLIDNAGFAYELIHFLKENNLRERCYLQFSYHGFLPYFGLEKGEIFVNEIDEFIFLTDLSKKQYEYRYPHANFYASVLHNGINKEVFKPRSRIKENNEVDELIRENNSCVFLWLANDRPKKGLLFILEVWKKFYENHPDTILWVVGSEQALQYDGVRFFGKFPNSELPRFYNSADIYLFPTQCQEGFGLSLIEALACDCYCIASNVGGVPEVLEYGKLGILVEPYDDKSVWYQEMEKAYANFTMGTNDNPFTLPQNLYSLRKWSLELSLIINSAKKRMSKLREEL